MGLFSSSKSSSSSNVSTTVNTDNSSHARDIGLTGYNAVNLANTMARAGTSIASIGAAQNYRAGENVKVFAEDAFAFLNNASNNVFRQQQDLSVRAAGIEDKANQVTMATLAGAKEIAAPDADMMKNVLMAGAVIMGLMVFRKGF